MNWDRVEGNWKEFKGKVQQKWGKLTDDDLDVIEGKRTELAGRLQQRYGVAKDDADRQIDTSAQRRIDRVRASADRQRRTTSGGRRRRFGMRPRMFRRSRSSSIISVDVDEIERRLHDGATTGAAGRTSARAAQADQVGESKRPR